MPSSPPLVSSLLFFLSAIHTLAPPSAVVDACYAAGVCGGIGPACLPPPPAPICAGGCGPGYGCGPYGCHRVRARVASSKTLKLAKMSRGGGRGSELEEEEEGGMEDQRQQQRRLATPDEKFMACCQDRNLPDECLNKCTFATFTRGALQNMYFRADPCPMQAAAEMQFCAAQGRDHSECCVRNGVASTLAGEKCLTFCNQIPGNVTQLDLSYMSCYDRFENMKGCFWHDIVRREKLRMGGNEDQMQQQRMQLSAAGMAMRKGAAAEQLPFSRRL